LERIFFEGEAPAEPRKVEQFLATKERKEHKNVVQVFKPQITRMSMDFLEGEYYLWLIIGSAGFFWLGLEK